MAGQSLRDTVQYDCIVIGAGIVGSWAAYQLVKQGARTLLLEQFCLPHSRGSSHGQSRIIRKTYAQDIYVQMMEEAYQLWAQAEEEGGEQLFVKTGLLMLGDKDNKVLNGSRETMERHNLPFDSYDSASLQHQFPHLNYPKDFTAILDRGAGVLKANTCLRVLQALIVKHGGKVLDGQRVETVIPGSNVTLVTHTGETYIGKNLIMTGGPWGEHLLRKVGLYAPLKPHRVLVFYWKAGKEYSASGHCPVISHTEGEPEGKYKLVYCLPCLEYPDMMKICLGESKLPAVDPERRDTELTAEHAEGDLKHLSSYIHRHFPGVATKPSIQETCMVTLTPDEHFIIDRHPQHNNIIIGLGFSGHGFKLAPVCGKLLSELAMNKPTSYDVTSFKLSRFPSPKL